MGALTKLRHSRPVGIARYHFYRDFALAWPKRHACNICGWTGRRFLTYYHRFVLCPKCGSHDRHRLIAATFQLHTYFSDRRLARVRTLHISPEYCVGLLLKSVSHRYVRADFGMMDSDVRQDITHMSFLNGAFDLVVCCDTLEHVADDIAALSECHRVLRAGGVAVLTVPQSDDKYETYEDSTMQSDVDRTRAFGQPDHVRNYGADFGDRVAAVGFRVTCVGADSFDAAVVRKHVLKPPIPRPEQWGWNKRRIYLAERI